MGHREVKISKFLSLVLRHQPEKIGLRLNDAGWIRVDDLLQASSAHNFPITLDELKSAVRNNDKQRFAFSPDESLIRANQGHSIIVELGYEPLAPPDILFHGTAERFIASIKEKGLIKGDRQQVHLSADEATASKVGQRHGKPVVLRVMAGAMDQEGYKFYQSENGVWLTDHVPINYLIV